MPTFGSAYTTYKPLSGQIGSEFYNIKLIFDFLYIHLGYAFIVTPFVVFSRDATTFDLSCKTSNFTFFHTGSNL